MENKKYSKLKAAFEATQPQAPTDFTERVMKRIEEQPSVFQSKRRWVWLYPTIAAIAASVLLLLTLHRNDNHVDPKQAQPVVTQQTKQKDSTLKTEKKELKPMIAQENPATDKTRAAIQRRTATVVAHKVSTTIPATDSLDYYIDKIERELAQVDESLYIERMNKVIRADERLQRIVNSYILHTLDKEGRPQTADNMYNVKTEEDEE
jgi:hypothetical protein